MENFERKKHWENINQSKAFKDVSWLQQTPETSLDFFKQFNVRTISKDIEISGGDSFLVNKLLFIKRFGKTRMVRRATHSSTLAIGGVSSPLDSFLLKKPLERKSSNH